MLPKAAHGSIRSLLVVLSLAVAAIGIAGFWAGRVTSKSQRPDTAQEQPQHSYTTEKPSENTIRPAGPAIKVSAVELVAAYQSNELAADKRFKGKLLEITGEVRRVTKANGRWRADLIGIDGAGIFAMCHFLNAHAGSIEAVAAGETLTVSGVCLGANVFGVVIEDCE